MKLTAIKKLIVLSLAGVAITLGSFILGGIGAGAAFNPEINYQGKLVNPSTNIEVPDGNYNIKFIIYDADSAGNCLWTARGTCDTPTARTIAVSSGLFSIMLGESGDNAISSLEFNQDLWLGVTIESDGEMTPRKKLGAVPAAFEADKLDGVDSLSFLRSDEADTMSASEAGTLLTVSQSGAGDIADLTGDSITTGTGLLMSVDGLTTGTGMDIASTSIAGTGSGSTKLLNLTRSGANTNAAHTAYGLYSSVTNTNATSGTNIAGYFSASGATTANYGLIVAGGNVGIGTTEPDSKLQIDSTTDYATLKINGQSVGVGAWSSRIALGINEGGVSASGVELRAVRSVYVNPDATDFAIAVAGSEWLRITKAGNVGIGTTTPGAKLEVAGSAKITSGNTIGISITQDNDFPSVLIADSGNDDSIRIIKTGTTAAGYSGLKIDTSSATGGNALSVNTNQLVLPMSGNVGIGTTSPTEKLHIYAASGTLGSEIESGEGSSYFQITRGDTGDYATLNLYTGDVKDWQIQTRADVDNGNALVFRSGPNSGTNRVTFLQDGNVGIGTTGPGASLDIKKAKTGSGVESIRMMRLGTTGTGAIGDSMNIEFFTPAGVTVAGISGILGADNVAYGSLAFSTRNYFTDSYDEAVRITNKGNVGIGTTAPGAKLEVSGSTTTTAQITATAGAAQLNLNGVGNYGQINNIVGSFFITNSAATGPMIFRTNGTEYMRLTNTGNVGIGTTAPEYKLDVTGEVRLGGTSGAPHLIFNRAGYNYIQAPTSGALAFLVNGDSANDVNSILVLRETGVSYFNKGNVGIGTTDPGSYKLNIEGKSFTKGLFVHAINEDSASSDRKQYSWEGITIDGQGANNAEGGRIDFTNTNGYLASIFPYGAGTGNGGHLLFYTSPDHTYAGLAERMVITNAGNVGIGTAEPGVNKLSVESTTRPQARFAYDAGRYVELGDTSLLATYGGNANNFSIGTFSASAGNGHLIFKTLNAEAMRIDHNGNVGIGTTAPGYVLDVQHATSKVNSKNGYLTNGSDYAEYFRTQDTDLQPGEAVCVDTTEENSVKRCQNSGDNNIMGIVSEKPSIVGNGGSDKENNPKYKIIGMLGQVTGKVTNENEEIEIGDSLTSASKAGYLRKANPGESTVGIALENFSSSDGNIQVMISRKNKSLTVDKVEEQITDRIARMEIEDEVNILISQAVDGLDFEAEMPVLENRIANIESNPLFNSPPWQGGEGYAWDINSSLIADLESDMDEIEEYLESLIVANTSLIETSINLIDTNTSSIANLKTDISAIKLTGLLDGELKIDKMTIDGEIVAGAFTVKIVDDKTPTIGSAVICPIPPVDEDNDGIDDETEKPVIEDVCDEDEMADGAETDGKSIEIETKAVGKNSKIFVTSKDITDQPLAVTEIISGESFRVEIERPTLKAINFNWWIVEAEKNNDQ